MSDATGDFDALQNKWLNEFCAAIADEPKFPGDMILSDCSGFPTTRFVTPHRILQLRDAFKARDGDVFLVTYMKSGTTWGQDLLKQLLGLPAHADPLTSVPWIEPDDRMFLGVPAAAFAAPSREVATMADGKGPTKPLRCFKSHWLPRDHLASENSAARKVVVIRDGRDVILSHFHHVCGFPLYNFRGTLSEFAALSLKGHVEFGSWFAHVAAWVAEAKARPDKVLLVRYEDLHEDCPRELRRISKFLGLERSEGQLAAIAKASSFDAMKGRVSYDKLRLPGKPFMRSGKVGDGATALSADDEAAYWAAFDRHFHPGDAEWAQIREWYGPQSAQKHKTKKRKLAGSGK